MKKIWLTNLLITITFSCIAQENVIKTNLLHIPFYGFPSIEVEKSIDYRQSFALGYYNMKFVGLGYSKYNGFRGVYRRYLKKASTLKKAPLSGVFVNAELNYHVETSNSRTRYFGPRADFGYQYLFKDVPLGLDAHVGLAMLNGGGGLEPQIRANISLCYWF